jgi:hypothetical protein
MADENEDLREWISNLVGVRVESVYVTDLAPKGFGMILGDFTKFLDEE